MPFNRRITIPRQNRTNTGSFGGLPRFGKSAQNAGGIDLSAITIAPTQRKNFLTIQDVFNVAKAATAPKAADTSTRDSASARDPVDAGAEGGDFGAGDTDLAPGESWLGDTGFIPSVEQAISSQGSRSPLAKAFAQSQRQLSQPIGSGIGKGGLPGALSSLVLSPLKAEGNPLDLSGLLSRQSIIPTLIKAFLLRKKG
jgi:hypothetical protein